LDTNDFWDIPLVPDAKPERKERQPGDPSGDGTLAKLYQKHPEGGGPYGGRDNAITAYVGYLRSTGIDYDGGLAAALSFNKNWLDPSLEEWEVSEKVGRAWAEWSLSVREMMTKELAVKQLLADRAKALEPKEARKKKVPWDWDRLQEEAAKSRDTEWIIPHVIARQAIHYFAGPPSSGKSWMAADLVRASQCAGNWMGIAPCVKSNVLYVNEEMGVGEYNNRFHLLYPEACRGLHSYVNENIKFTDPDDLEDIIDAVKEKNIDIVIVDTFVRVHNLDENSNSEMSQLYQHFKRVTDAGAALVVLHHARKGATGSLGHESMRGAVEIAAQAETVLSIENKMGHYTVKTVKQRRSPFEDQLNFEFKIHANAPNDLEIRRIDIATEEKTLDQAILDYIGENPGQTSQQIADGVKKRKTDVVKALQGLEDESMLNVMHGARGAKFYSPFSMF
jgi:RecA-family ATPase